MSRQILVKNIPIGGGAPVSVQSMTNTPTADYDATYRQVCLLHDAGADIVRVTLNEPCAVDAFAKLCATSPVPIVADIHFDYRLALAAVDAGAAKIRVNPGNISKEAHVAQVAQACAKKHISIRIGVNAGSLSKQVEHNDVAAALVQSALTQARLLEKYGLYDICLSVKSSDVATTYRAYTLLRAQCDYPLHIGVTETGVGSMALAKSNACLGGLLLAGIGDTVRISLSADPIQEVQAGVELLRAIGLRNDFVNIIACPTCGRTTYDVIGISEQIQSRTAHIRKPLKVAVMGCVVNGSGEGADADMGVAGGKDKSILFCHGRQVGTVSNDRVLDALLAMIEEATNG